MSNEIRINGIEDLYEYQQTAAKAIVRIHYDGGSCAASSLSLRNEGVWKRGDDVITKYEIDGDMALYVVDMDGDTWADVMPSSVDIVSYLRTWDMGDALRHVFLAEWGVGDGPEAVGDDYDGAVSIWRVPNWYASSYNAPHADYIRGDWDGRGSWENILTFPTYVDAQAWIDAREQGIYVTQQGEAGRPEYRIVEEQW